MVERLYPGKKEYDYNKLYGILYACPTNNRIENCPLSEVSHLSFKEKLIWFDGLDTEKKDCILVHHVECSQKKRK
ncbi:hypothetical protein SAMN06265379_11235 [Saccharicrinis carchari]|uniref:Uncharacterized protein n=1 Tax=Saccharicrinis carchari TaxID=1168039 RepID=A0A521EZJ9_SACCC|nr:hypothetical protein SAMN06265379_11235 [Saccharicrinis carchari]